MRRDDTPRGGGLRPAQVCAALLGALDAADGRRRSRKRDQTPDAIGLAVKRALLEQAVRDDPDAPLFEAWLMDYGSRAPPQSTAAALAMARSVYEEWQLACRSPEFACWLESGAPSADATSHRRAT